MAKPQGLRERKSAEAKQALHTAAMKLFREKGFDETSVDEIAERAGYSRATFFNHFGAKQGVLRHYGQELLGHVEALVRQADPALSPLELIRQAMFAMVAEAEAKRDELKLVYAHSMRDPDYLFEATPARKRIYELFRNLVDQAVRRKEIRDDLPAEDIALHILFLYNGVVLALITGIGQSENLLNSAWRFILGGIHGDDSPTSRVHGE